MRVVTGTRYPSAGSIASKHWLAASELTGLADRIVLRWQGSRRRH